MATSAKAGRFHHLQLRSVLDDAPDAGPDAQWQRLLESGCLRRGTAAQVQLALPDAAEAEDCLLRSVEKLADAVSSKEPFSEFYKHYGWESARQYFGAMGEVQVMFVDTDHNDLDDRLAIIVLAFQMASANSDRRAASPAAACALHLDCRTYEGSGNLTVRRTARLAARLARLLGPHGLAVEIVLSDRQRGLALVAAASSGSPPGPDVQAAAADAAACGAGAALGSAGARADLAGAWPPSGQVTLWILSGLCAAQVRDVSAATGPRLVLVEQAQPAWQSVAVAPDAELQPPWEFPPARADAERGFGAEPSNIRSGEEPYPELLDTYMRLQELVAKRPENFEYVCPALAREAGALPAPPGQRMRRVAGRPLTVLPGVRYEVKRARDSERATAAFAHLLAVSEAAAPDTLYPELCQGALDDDGAERREVAHIVKYGTFMSDAILVALAARPAPALRAIPVVRRLALVALSPGKPPDEAAMENDQKRSAEEQGAGGAGGLFGGCGAACLP